MAERLPRARPVRDAITEALTSDRPVKAQDAAPRTAPEAAPGQLSEAEYNRRLASLCERIMATASIAGDPRPLQQELEELMKVAPPGKKEELEKNRGKPPATPTPATPKG